MHTHTPVNMSVARARGLCRGAPRLLIPALCQHQGHMPEPLCLSPPSRSSPKISELAHHSCQKGLQHQLRVLELRQKSECFLFK